jgi:AcrR family transcriptional regulator
MINAMVRGAPAEVFPTARRSAMVPSTASAGARSSQRRRLLSAITQLAIDEQYTNVTVGQIVAAAGVSRATFYGHFLDREECFAAALVPIRAQVLAGIRRSVVSDRPERAVFRSTHGLLAFARSRPGMARLLMSDSMTGGGRLRAARDGFVDDIARIIEEAHGRLPAGAVVADLPPGLICGVVCRMLATRLRSGGRLSAGGTLEDLFGWIAAYELPLSGHRWHAFTELPSPSRSPFLPPSELHAPLASALDGARAPEGALIENQWLRIVFATVEVIGRDGYASSTVTQIAETAGVDSRAFYRLFAGKREALAAAGELLFRNAMAVAAGAFVAGADWPEHVWEAARAVAQYAEQHATLTYVSLVESLAGGSSAIGRVEDLTRAFTIFLQEGTSHPGVRAARSDPGSSELALEAICASVSELVYRYPREDPKARLSSLLAPAVFIALAPFLGADEAGEFVCRQGSQEHEHPQLTSVA